MNIDMSTEIGELVKALCKAQAEFKPFVKRGYNPHFKSQYALLEDILESTRPALAKYGLLITQLASSTPTMAGITTILAHESGEWFKSLLLLPARDATAQGLGGCITYARRYALAAILNVDSETDDDGQGVSHQAPQTQNTSPQPQVVSTGYLVPFGKHKGKPLNALQDKEILDYILWLEKSAKDKGESVSVLAREFIKNGNDYLNTLKSSKPESSMPDFGDVPF